MFRSYSGNPKKFWLRRLAVSLVMFMCLMALSHYPGFKELFEADRALPISDVGEVLILSLHQERNSSVKVGKVKIHLYGEIDGRALLQPLDEHEPFSTYPVGPGKIDLKVEIPWDKPKLSLRYTPTDVKDGMLNLKYRYS